RHKHRNGQLSQLRNDDIPHGRHLLAVSSSQPANQKRPRLRTLFDESEIAFSRFPAEHPEQAPWIGPVCSPDGLRPDDSVHGYWVAEEHQRLLQQTVRRRRTHVDGHVENLCGHGFVVDASMTIFQIEVAVVDGYSALSTLFGYVR